MAIEYLHMMGVIYRDLKPENVLIREDGHIMLSDFDLSLKCEVVPRLFRPRPQRCEAVKKEDHDDEAAATTCVGEIPPVLSCFSLSSSESKRKKKKKKSKKPSESPEGSEESPAPEVVVEPASARSRSFVGTHEYLAPEVIAGSGHGAAVDWWTLGVLLYELLHGKTPFKGSTNEETIINIIKHPLSFPKSESSCKSSRREEEELSRAHDLISKLLVKNPKKRLGSCKGALEIKRHEFFKGVNWALIRSVRPPEVPRDWKKKMSMALVNRESKKMNHVDRGSTYQIPQQFDYF